jgi:hypothetical protein
MIWQPGKTLAQVEKEVIYKALQFFRGNKVQTAKALDISERTLYNKLEIYEGKKEKNQLDGIQTERGDDIQPPQELSEKQPMSMREQEKIQEMPLKPTSRLHTDSGSKRAKAR